jgi:hypothetical protein
MVFNLYKATKILRVHLKYCFQTDDQRHVFQILTGNHLNQGAIFHRIIALILLNCAVLKFLISRCL